MRSLKVLGILVCSLILGCEFSNSKDEGASDMAETKDLAAFDQRGLPDLGHSTLDLIMAPDLTSVIADLASSPDIASASDMIAINRGALEIRNIARSASKILIPGPALQTFRTFDICADQVEDVRIEAVRIYTYPNSDPIAKVGLWQIVNGMNTIIAEGIPMFDGADVFPQAPCVIRKGTCESFGIGAVVADVFPGGTGKYIDLVVSSGGVSGIWGQAYANAFRIRARGLASSETIYVQRPPFPLAAQPSVVRKTVLTILPKQVADPRLVIGAKAALRRWMMSADAAGPGHFRKITFRLVSALAPGDRLILTGFSLLKGNVALPQNEYDIRDGSGKDLKAGTWEAGVNDPLIVVSLRDDLTIGAGQSVDLQVVALLGGNLQNGASLSVSFVGDVDPLLTGFLSADGLMEGALIGPHLDLGQKPGGPYEKTYFVWSDDSDNNTGHHWINGAWLGDFSGVQVLVK